MAWLSAAVRWPDALVESDYSPIHVVEKYRPHLPPTLRALPAPFLLALPVLLFFLTLTVFTAVFRPTPKGVPAHLASGRKAQRKSGARTVLLLGPSDSGKTSIFSALVFGSVPKTHTSQHESEGHTILGPPGPLPGEQQVSPGSSVPVHLIDLPGHPRLRVRANDFLPVADALVFCVDATLAARAATSSTAQGAAAALSEAIE
jgi:signal recognition particle receptor subunit beta